MCAFAYYLNVLLFFYFFFFFFVILAAHHLEIRRHLLVRFTSIIELTATNTKAIETRLLCCNDDRNFCNVTKHQQQQQQQQEHKPKKETLRK